MSAPSPSAAVGLPDLGLGGSAVIVTGAGSGIGAAAARHLGAAGASVVLVGRRTELLKTVAGAITSGGGQALCFPADLALAASPRRITDACLGRFGPIAGLVNNAAVVRHLPLSEWAASGFDEHVAPNVPAPFFLIQPPLPPPPYSPLHPPY